MYKVYEIDYHGRSYFLGSANTLKDAQALERKALKRSGGEFPTFSENCGKCVTCNSKII